MDSKKLKDAEDFYSKHIKGGILIELEKTLPLKTHFLTTLCSLIYTEVIGAFLPPHKKEIGSFKSKRFYRCLFRLKSGEYLKNIDKGLKKDTGKNIYEHLRHSMSHIFLPSVRKKENGKISFLPIIIARDGFFNPSEKRTSPIYIDSRGLTIAYKNYFLELKEAVELFYKKTFIDNDEEYQNSAIRGVDYILQR